MKKIHSLTLINYHSRLRSAVGHRVRMDFTRTISRKRFCYKQKSALRRLLSPSKGKPILKIDQKCGHPNVRCSDRYRWRNINYTHMTYGVCGCRGI